MPGRVCADLAWVADRCLRVSFAQDTRVKTLARVHAAARAIAAAGIAGLRESTPAYATLLLTFDLTRLDLAQAEKQVLVALGEVNAQPVLERRQVEIPVCYEGECGLDLDGVGAATGMTRAGVVAAHAGARYVVAFLGFAPGFPYLEGLPQELAVPRRQEPRTRVPWGSVAIAGNQAGIYPHATAGGWHIVGRTPLRLFDATRATPALLQYGDAVRFVSITHAQHVVRAGRAL
jgi:inhibitor of KinA